MGEEIDAKNYIGKRGDSEREGEGKLPNVILGEIVGLNRIAQLCIINCQYIALHNFLVAFNTLSNY